MFNLTAQQRDIKLAAKEFAEGEFSDIAFDHDENETFPNASWKKAGEAGFIGGFIEEKYDGMGLGLLEYLLIAEEFWRVDPGCGSMLLTTIGSEFIQDFGNEEQKNKYLRQLSYTESVMGTVPSTEYIFKAFQYTKAGENQFRLSGTSKFVINGAMADYLIIIAEKTNSNTNEEGVYTTFIVPNKQDGVRAIRMADKLGLRAIDISEIELQEVTVTKSEMIGKEGDGLKQFGAFQERLGICMSALATGAAQGCLDRSIKYSKQREQFGHPIGWFPQVQLKIAEMATRVEASRYLYYEAASLYDSGKKNSKLVSMASWFAREASAFAAAETLQIHGGYGYMKEMDIERFYRDVQFLEILGNSKEKEKLSVAKRCMSFKEGSVFE